MSQNRKRENDMPNRASNMEPAEGSRDTATDERNSGGITNRPLSREQQEQDKLPDRGHSSGDEARDRRSHGQGSQSERSNG
jgi:hypothetical protein